MSRSTPSDRPTKPIPADAPASPLHEPEPIRELNRHIRKSGPSGLQEPHAADQRTGDLFAWGAKQRQFEKTGSLSARPPRGPGASLGLERHSVRDRRDRRFRVFLESGSFGPGEPVEDDHPVTRNRILFFGLLLAMIVFSLVKTLGG
jgi:hypothetical protein